jgi:predicted phage tail protein
VTTYDDTGLAASTTYGYRVRATNTGGDSAYSNTAEATTQAPPPPPAAPSGLGATAVSSSQINLSWTDNANNETGFKIERCQNAGCSNFAQIATVGANVTTYSNTGLTPSTSYSYRVRATNASGDSAYSNTASATTQATATVPAAPSNLTATAVSTSQINLSWTDNSNNETNFNIERCQGNNCSNFVQIATTGANVVTFNNTGLARNTRYRYRVRASNAVGNSAYSNIAAARTLR